MAKKLESPKVPGLFPLVAATHTCTQEIASGQIIYNMHRYITHKNRKLK